MGKNTPNDDLKNSVLHSLGDPTVGVELNNDQMNSLYSIAIETYELFSGFNKNSFKELQIKQPWINAYFRALCMETMANIRGKFKKVPVADTELILNYTELYNAAINEKGCLRNLFFI